MSLLELESFILSKLLAGEQELFVQLRQQYSLSNKRFDVVNGAGFFVYYELNTKNLASVTPIDFELDDFYIDFSEPDFSIGCILFVRKGFIDYLDVWTISKSLPQWPSECTIRHSYYLNAGEERSERDCDWVLKKINGEKN